MVVIAQGIKTLLLITIANCNCRRCQSEDGKHMRYVINYDLKFPSSFLSVQADFHHDNNKSLAKERENQETKLSEREN